MPDDAVRRLLDDVARGVVPVEEAVERLALSADLGFATPDFDRRRRTGMAEVIYGAAKSADQLVALLVSLGSRDGRALATRVDADKAERAAQICPGLRYDLTSRLLSLGERPELTGTSRVCVVAAGTSDLPVSEEAAQVMEWGGTTVDRVTDVGVSGLHRLFARLPVLRAADVLIVVAGMEGALPSVVAGLVSAPVIAVPTSVGLGLHEGGRVPLMAMLNSCAAGLVVVNVDNGFGAGAAALRMIRRKD